MICPKCNGIGMIDYSYTCPHCDGEKNIPTDTWWMFSNGAVAKCILWCGKKSWVILHAHGHEELIDDTIAGKPVHRMKEAE